MLWAHCCYVRPLCASMDANVPYHTEALTMVQRLLSQSPDIQKILAFEGAFEKLFNIISQEGGVEGGHMVHDSLLCVDSLLRYNTSNQVCAKAPVTFADPP